MLSTSFDPHIINYESSREFIVPKFTMYDGTSDPFDHIMHFRQLMTLDIGNDALCKSLAKKSSATMDDLFKRADKYSMLEDNVRDDEVGSFKSSNQSRQASKRQTKMTQELVVQASTSLVAPRVVINYIHGGPIDDRHSSKWVLVDLGSSVDLLQMLAYKQMGYSPSALENPRRLMFKFNGDMTTFLGDVVLPVQAGPITLNIQFPMTDDLSPYNAIMGRAWLHKMKVIPFTYHQMVRYLIEKGQVDLLHSQLAARQCYQVALDSGHPTDEETHLESSNTKEQ
ncbi:hypothetical protein AAG906_001679 [Vitis piasezkii]